MDRRAGWRLWLPLGLMLLFLLLPFYWMVLTSLKDRTELLNTPNPWWVFHPSINSFVDLLTQTQYPRWFLNTLYVSVGATALSIVVSYCAAFAIVRLKFKGARALSTAIFFSYVVPPAILFIPLAEVLVKLGWFNHLWALIPIYATFLVPFCTWLLIGFLRSIPRELEEAALVDGASWPRIMIKVILPLSVPGLISATIFSFTLSWNEYLYALIYMFSSDNKTITVGLTTELMRGDVFQWGQLMAGSLLGTLPVVLVYFFFVEYYVAGMSGALKD
ncbi:carbohydrate ABC transporter permease [Acidimangrovimonas sediminis]|uniref:carbohydrate ABC transporter permease n=1 Tax=Acidimangrovimonas sediminis TaxID=2056283 RepID=UPI000C80B0D1|nr:carbohydrate ABC transporter permease [Acidimangrovimonas sediminis]